MTETELRMQLRQLPREIEPPHDLWPAIRSGIRRPALRAPGRWLGGLAMAASVLLAAGLFWRGAADPRSAPTAADAVAGQIVAAEGRAITEEYQAALRQFDGAPLGTQWGPSLHALDRSLVQIQRAMAADPDSIFLLHQLRRTYSRRLQLTQRAVAS